MKKSFSLLITLFFISILSYISISIMQTKSLQTKNIQNQYLYIQGKNHMSFFKNYIKSLNLSDINKVQMNDDLFEIYALIKEKQIDIFVKAKNYNISIYEKIIR